MIQFLLFTSYFLNTYPKWAFEFHPTSRCDNGREIVTGLRIVARRRSNPNMSFAQTYTAEQLVQSLIDRTLGIELVAADCHID